MKNIWKREIQFFSKKNEILPFGDIAYFPIYSHVHQRLYSFNAPRKTPIEPKLK